MMNAAMIYLAYLAETMVSGDWLISALKGTILALGTGGAAWIVAWKKGEAKGREGKVTIQEPMPEVPTKRVYSPPTYWQHRDLERRMDKAEGNIDQLRRDLQEQFRMLMSAGETRKDEIFKKIDDTARAYHSRVDQLMKSNLHPSDD